jgi:hypothetical protein
MEFCQKSYSDCIAIMSELDRRTNVRLIDVLERCVVDSDLSEKYVALSYSRLTRSSNLGAVEV